MNPEWGSTEEVYLRASEADYADGTSSPAGEDRVSAREISNLIAAQGDQNLLNDRNLSAFVYAWGQFLDHDIDLTSKSDLNELFAILVPTGDEFFDPTGTGTQTIPLSRSEYSVDANGIRQQVNSITAFIDGSQVYGSSKDRSDALRTFQGGLLKISDGNLLPFNTAGLENDTAGGGPASYFLAGDVRANENIEWTAMQTLFMREHNRLAKVIAANHPDWRDERIFQAARRWVIGELQSITYNEFLPAILGKNAVSSYRSYDATVCSSIWHLILPKKLTPVSSIICAIFCLVRRGPEDLISPRQIFSVVAIMVWPTTIRCGCRTACQRSVPLPTLQAILRFNMHWNRPMARWTTLTFGSVGWPRTMFAGRVCWPLVSNDHRRSVRTASGRRPLFVPEHFFRSKPGFSRFHDSRPCHQE